MHDDGSSGADADACAGGSGRLMILYVLDFSQHGFQF